MSKSKEIKIEIPTDNDCLKAIKRLYFKATLKGSFGFFGMACVLSYVWLLIFPSPVNGNSLFDLFGMVIFGLIVQSIFIAIKHFNETNYLKSKDSQFLRLMYIELVKTGDIKPVLVSNKPQG